MSRGSSHCRTNTSSAFSCDAAEVPRCSYCIATICICGLDGNALDKREWLVTADDDTLPPGIYAYRLEELLEEQIKQIESVGGLVVHEEMMKRLDGICRSLLPNDSLESCLEYATWARAVQAFKSHIVLG